MTTMVNIYWRFSMCHVSFKALPMYQLIHSLYPLCEVGNYSFPHFMDEETEAQIDYLTYPRSGA